jgi:hypothetical protein
MLKSSKAHRGKNPAAGFTAQRAEALLQFWANLADVNADEFRSELESLTKSAPESFGTLIGLLEAADSQSVEERREDLLRSVWGLREHLRAAWQATDLREREWYIYELRRLYTRHTAAASLRAMEPAFKCILDRLVSQNPQSESASVDMQRLGAELGHSSRFYGYWVDPPPALTVFERTMFHFQRIAYRARKCENPECMAPCFFMKRKGQKYCTEECALPAQRKAKSEWWARNRDDQMKKRRQRESKDTAEPLSAAEPRTVVQPKKKGTK